MPTGYTHDLEQRNYDVKSWLKESVIRAMGVCITVRDHGNMKANEIKAALKKEVDEPYHAKHIKRAQEELIEFKSLNPVQLFARYEKELAEARGRYAERVNEFERKKKAHHKAMVQTESLLDQAENEGQGEVIVNTLKFALEQLESSFKFDYGSGPWKEDILSQDFETWSLARRSALLHDIEYHAKELNKEETRNNSRFEEFDKFIRWVDKSEPKEPKS